MKRSCPREIFISSLTTSAVGLLFIGIASTVQAVPYASGLRNTTGTTYEFILNEAADNVTIQRDSGGDIDLGAIGTGRHTFDLAGATTFDIVVSHSAPAGLTPIDDTANLFTSFDRPGGLAINKIPTSPFFGTVYVNQNRSLSGVNPIVTGAGRMMGNGVYSLTADRLGVDLPTFNVPASANDLSLAKAPAGITILENFSSSLYRIGMDDGGNIIAVDWSDGAGGLKYISADLTTAAVLLRDESGPTGGVPSNSGAPLHGSINGTPQVTGTYGVDLVVSAMDEDLDSDLTAVGANDGNNVWTWNIGSTTSNYAGAPKLEIAVGDLYTSTGQDRHTSGVQGILTNEDVGIHSDGTQVFLSLNIGITANAQYNEHFDKWYLSGSRRNGDDSSSLVILTPEGVGGDGRDIVVDWASKQFTIDNGLDGFTDDAGNGFSLDPHNDIFRQTHNVTFSPDNKTMYLHRRAIFDTNPILGTNTPLGATILAIPLDEDGLPIIDVNDNGTPGITSDDFITNFTPIATPKNSNSQGSYSVVETDIAGNLYFTDSISQRLEYFSLGGNSIATTSNNAALSAGAFNLVIPEPASILLAAFAALSIPLRIRAFA